MKVFPRVNPLLFCLALYILFSVISYHLFGTKVVSDSARYLEYAEGLKNGFYLDPHNRWYLGYVTFIFLINLISENLLFIVVVQYLIGLVAILALYKAIFNFSSSKIAAFSGALYFLLFIEPITWHSYLLAESLLASCICILLYFLSKVTSKPTKRGYIIFFLVLFFTSLIKPTALGVLFSLAVFIIYYFLREASFLRVTIVSFILISLLFLLNKSLATYTIFENDYLKGQIIYGFEKMKNLPYTNWFLVDVPDNIMFPDKSYSKLTQIVLFIFYNPLYWLKLFSLKVFYFLLHARPYWSIPHIIHSIFFMVVGLSSFIYLMLRTQLATKIKIILFSFIVFQILAVGITTIDYDGRFIIPLIPIYALSFGIIFSRLKKLNILSKKSELIK